MQGIGSGFVISRDGIVITNHHVVEGAEQIVVTTRSGDDYPAILLGEDPLTDIAVLRIEGRDLATARLGRSADLMIGEWVVAFGNPYGYLLGNTEPTVSVGVVSATDRNLLPSDDQRGLYVGMIQTDAAINPGNSGGPLANAAGEVVGVNNSIFWNTGGSVGIGFAIPIERALRVASELQVHGSVRRAWVGLDVQGSGLRDWKQTGGLRVAAVAPDGPAVRAGVRVDDVLIRAGGRRLRTFLDWEGVKLDIGVGDSLVVDLRRARRERATILVVEDLPSTRAEKVAVLGDIRVVTVTPAIRQERGIQSTRGALIYEIGEGARRATGLQIGDVVLQVNREPVQRAEEVSRALRAAAGRTPIRVYFERNDALSYTDFYVR